MKKKNTILTFVLVASILAVTIPTTLFLVTNQCDHEIAPFQTDYILRGKIVTMENETAIVPDGKILVRGGMIEAVWDAGGSPPSHTDVTGIPVIDTNGTIYPGLIDTHNHLLYNTIPIWNVTPGYTNRYEWQESNNIEPDIENPHIILTYPQYADLSIEVTKYAEIKALIGGTTSIQGSTICRNEINALLVRNIEHANFGKDMVLTRVGDIDTWEVNEILNARATGNLDALFVHVGEGTDQLSHDEFNTLKNKGLLIEGLVAIHAMAFNRSDFAEMAAVDAKMVWSPTSNLLYYGTTADVQAAWEEGVTVALAPDWAPGGAKNVLGELKTADQWNKGKLGNFFSDYNLVEMVTTNAAEACGWENLVGKIKAGFHADLLVLNEFNGTYSPYRTLIEAIDFDVKLVIVEGNPLYGVNEIFTVLKPGDYEFIDFGGWNRSLDVTDGGVNKGDQTFAEMNNTLSEMMSFDPNVMFNYFTGGQTSVGSFTNWLNARFPSGYHAIPLDPIHTYGDSAYFNALSTSTNLNNNFTCNISSYYQRAPL